MFSRGLYYQVDGNQDTFFEIRFVSYFIYSAFLSVTLWENDTPVIKSVLKGHFCPGLTKKSLLSQKKTVLSVKRHFYLNLSSVLQNHIKKDTSVIEQTQNYNCIFSKPYSL